MEKIQNTREVNILILKFKHFNYSVNIFYYHQEEVGITFYILFSEHSSKNVDKVFKVKFFFASQYEKVSIQ